MSTTAPAYAKAKTITSNSGLNAAVKHRNTLRLARTLLQAQNTPEATQAATMLVPTIQAYYREIMAWYDSPKYQAWVAQYR